MEKIKRIQVPLTSKQVITLKEIKKKLAAPLPDGQLCAMLLNKAFQLYIKTQDMDGITTIQENVLDALLQPANSMVLKSQERKR